MNLEEFGIIGCEVYFSAVCNLECVYCFQPKLKEHGACKNKEIIEWISSGKMEDDIEETFGSNIESIALWGGEPTINLPYLSSRIDSLLDRFGKLSIIDFSTNISQKILADNIIALIKSVDQYLENKNRSVTIRIQYSLDGPPEINDRNRLGSSAVEIIQNILAVQDFINTKPHNCAIQQNFKGTHDSVSIERLSHRENLERFYQWYDDFYKECRQRNYKNFPKSGEYITIVFPGNWVKQDGENFTKILLILRDPEFRKKFSRDVSFRTQLHGYIGRIEKLSQNVRSQDRYNSYGYSMSCGALKRNLALSPGGKLSICHHSFFFDDDARKEIKERDLITDFEKSSGFSFNNYDYYFNNKERSSLKEDPLKILRTLDCGRKSMTCSTLRMQYQQMMIKEMAKNQQINIDPNDEEKIKIASNAILYSGCECVINNLWETGSYSTRNPSIFRLLFNGAFELILEDLK